MARLYGEWRDLLIISPHGHTDPEWFADAPFTDATSLLRLTIISTYALSFGC